MNTLYFIILIVAVAGLAIYLLKSKKGSQSSEMKEPETFSETSAEDAEISENEDSLEIPSDLPSDLPSESVLETPEVSEEPTESVEPVEPTESSENLENK